MVKVSLVHDWVVDLGGAEKCLQSLHNLYPEASLYTMFYQLESLIDLGFDPAKVYASSLQRKPNIINNYRRRLATYPYHIEQLNLDDSDVVISSSHCVAKGVMARSDQLHICYCHTPVRYAWEFSSRFLTDYGFDRGIKASAARVLLHYLRNWDVQSSNRVDHFIASSRTVAQRIWRAYRRRSQVIYPPVEVNRFVPKPIKEDYFLFVSRLVPAKMATLVIETFNQIGQPLIVVGSGPQLELCRKMARKNVEVIGYVPDRDLVELMGSAQALIFPAEDDFGIVPVEAQAAGAPVIALNRGGARETVIEASGNNWDEATGIYFEDQSVEALTKAVKKFNRWEGKFKTDVISNHAQQFSRERYEQEMESYIRSHYLEWQEERII